MAPLTAAHVRALLNPPAPPCVSLYMPTHRGAPDRREDRIRFKNLVRQAGEQVRSRFAAAKAQSVTDRLEPLIDDTAFWTGTTDGLAAFAAADRFEVYRFPRTVKEFVTVADSFHLKPLLRYTQSADRFHVLGLTRTEATLFEGDRYGLRPVESAGVLPTFDEAVGTEVTTPSREVLTVGGRSRTTGHYSAGGGGGGRKDEIQIDTEKFFREVDRAVTDRVSEPAKLPLILVALTEHQSEFRKISKNPHLIDGGVESDPGALSLEKLRAAAWEVFEPRYTRRLAELIEAYGTAAARQKAAHIIADVARACRDGRVGTLLVDADKTLPGRVDLASGEVRFGNAADPTVDDLIDDLAEQALLTGADVVVVPRDKMPTDTGLAAIFRY
jgi:hypothetical protein